jgi:hypothetical protein
MMVGVNEAGLRVGQDHPKAVLTDREVELARQLHAQGWTYPAISEKLEVSRWSIGRICRHERRNQVVARIKPIHDDTETR